MTRLHWLGFVGGALLLGGCEKESTHETTGMADAGTAMVATSTPAPVQSASATPSAPAAMEASETPPTERRAERKAVNEINHANYKSEMSKLEKELGSP